MKKLLLAFRVIRCHEDDRHRQLIPSEETKMKEFLKKNLVQTSRGVKMIIPIIQLFDGTKESSKLNLFMNIIQNSKNNLIIKGAIFGISFKFVELAGEKGVLRLKMDYLN